MQKEAVMKLVGQIINAYPNAYSTYGRSDIEAMVETWAMALEDYDDDAIKQAFKNFLLSDTKGFPPSIGQIVDLIPMKAGAGDGLLTAGEAWTLVLHALRTVTYNPTDSFDKLPDLIQRIVGGVDGLRNLANLNDKGRDVEKQRFMSEYKDAIKEMKAEAKRTGKELPRWEYRDEDPNIDAPTRPRELRRESYPFEGAVEVANPRTGVLFYVKYAGYPAGQTEDGKECDPGEYWKAHRAVEDITAWKAKLKGRRVHGTI